MIFDFNTVSYTNKLFFLMICFIGLIPGLRVFSRMFFPRTSLAFGVKLVPQRLETFFKEALSKSNRKPNNFLDVMFKLKENEPGKLVLF